MVEEGGKLASVLGGAVSRLLGVWMVLAPDGEPAARWDVQVHGRGDRKSGAAGHEDGEGKAPTATARASTQAVPSALASRREVVGPEGSLGAAT